MRIAFFSENFYPELSGVSDSIILLARELSRQGHMIRFYAPWYPARDYHKIHTDAHTSIFGKGIDIVRLPSSPYPTGTGQGRLVVPLGWALRSLHRWRPDIIHVQQSYGVGLEAVLASRVLRVPLIGTVHESTSEFVYHSPIQGVIVTRLLLRYASWFYNRCRYVTAPSSFLFSQMISNGFHRPHRALSNPIDVDRFHPADASQRALLRERFDIRGPAIIYAGRLAPEKHVDTCLRAFARTLKQVPDATLLISGYGSSEWALKELAKNLSIES
jgi:1,2-diacylglycerol 3-alpha-glucosyltransferase